MSPFEYVSVLLSLILGLGLTLILTGVARLLKRWNRISLFGPYFIWIVLVFILHIHEWWETYQFRSLPYWSMPMFLFVALYPILLFILANLLFPNRWQKNFNTKKFYFSICGKFFLFTIVLSLLSILQNTFLLGRTILQQPIQLIVASTFTIMLIWKTKNVIIHYGLALTLLLLLVGTLIFTSSTLLIQ